MEPTYLLNKYKKEIESHEYGCTPQYILAVFGVESPILREAFINIVAKINQHQIVADTDPSKITLKLDFKPGDFIDVYDVLKGFNITDPALQHGIKKLLMTGKRGHKDEKQDLMEIISAFSRAVTQRG
jgi:hypothetical protein